MDKQIKYLVGVLILILITSFFFSLLGELPQYFKDDIIAFLEEEFSGDISFSSVSLWPLNRIRLKSFSYTDKNKNKFAVKELKLDYNLNLTDFNNLIELKFIEAEAAQLFIREKIFTESELENKAKKEKLEETAADINSDNLNFNIEDLNLPEFISKINVNLTDSKLYIKNKKLDLEFNNLNLGLKAEAKNRYKINLSTAVNLKQIAAADFNLNNFSSEKINLELIRNKAEADLYLKADNLKLKDLLRFLNKREYNFKNFNIDLNSLAGDFSTKALLKIKKSQIIDYNAEIDLSGLKLESIYKKSAIKEKINLNLTDFSLIVSGPELKIQGIKNRISIDQNEIKLDFKVEEKEGNYNYQAQISGRDFDYDYDILEPYFNKANFDFTLNLEGAETEINQIYGDLKAESILSKYGKFKDSKLKFKLIDNEIIIDDTQLKLGNGSELNLKADYDLPTGKYQFRAEAQDFLISPEIISALEEYQEQSDFLKENLAFFKKIEADQLNFEINTAGYNRPDKALSAAGNVNIDYNLAAKENNLKFAGKFWLTDNILYLESLNLTSDFGYLDLMGEINFNTQQLNLRYAAKNFEIATLNQFYDLDIEIFEQIDPDLKYIEGKINNNFTNPNLTIDMELREFKYQDYLLEDIAVKAVYQNNNLKFREIKAELNQGLIRATGEIKNISTEFLMDFNLKSENLYFQDLAINSNFEIPLNGEIELEADLKGPLADYELDFNFNSNNIVINYQNEEFNLSNLTTVIKKEKEKEEFEIETLSFKHRNLLFKAAGIYDLKAGFDLKYSLEGIEPRSYLLNYSELAGDFVGSVNIRGELNGLLNNLVAVVELESDGLHYDNLEIKIKENNSKFKFKEKKLVIDEFNFTFAAGEYQLKGEIFDFTNQLQSQFKLSLLKVPSSKIIDKYLGIYPFAAEIILNGEIRAETKGNEYLFDLDLDLNTKENNNQILNLSGKVGEEIFLDFEGQGVPIEFINNQYGFNFKLVSDLDLTGNLRGSFKSPILNLKHNFYNLKINNTALESLTGDLLLERGRRCSISESIEFIEGGKLDFGGSYSLIEDELNFNSKLKSLPLDFILSFFGDKLNSDAVINGDFRAEGKLNSPDLSGSLNLKGNVLNLGLWNSINDFSVGIELQDEQALIKELKAKFGEESFNLTGHLKLFEIEEFWNLNLNGQDLYFDYGSLEGNFEPELEFTGPLMAPLLKGRIKFDDFLIKIPFEWPTPDNQDANTDDAFIPRIDLKLIPEENVRVKNANMDILVEEGDLSLNFNHRRQNSLMMEGELSSKNGRFKYYNSRFNLNNAAAIFTPVDEEDIPSLQVNATTYAGGREINVNLNGPANNMNISFSSSPEMTEEEILNLLSSRGALGSAIIGGEDIGIRQIIFQELIRIANGFLQEDLISDIESDVRTILSLDRIEIDALQYGLNREFAIYLGKNLNKRFYLEYAAFFGEEAGEDEISFQYRLTEITNLKGSYVGDGEYQITVETEIEF